LLKRSTWQAGVVFSAEIDAFGAVSDTLARVAAVPLKILLQKTRHIVMAVPQVTLLYHTHHDQ
jgi:hypothetical protein